MQKKIKLSEKLMEKHGKIRYRFMNAYLFATVFQKNLFEYKGGNFELLGGKGEAYVLIFPVY